MIAAIGALARLIEVAKDFGRNVAKLRGGPKEFHDAAANKQSKSIIHISRRFSHQTHIKSKFPG